MSRQKTGQVGFAHVPSVPSEPTDEERLISLIKGRLDQGRQTYGPLNIETDDRDFTAETLEEILDGMIYIAAQILTIKRTRGQGEPHTPEATGPSTVNTTGDGPLFPDA